jgi:F-type H+-transporting ATPase subunit gamma
MGADIKSLRVRMKSVDSTLHLTKAMGLVASSKIRRATEAMNKSKEYKKAVDEIVSLLTACPECKKSPYMRNTGGERTRFIVVAGDRGLAGGYNANIFRTAREFEGAEFITVGKRACDRFGSEANSSENFSYGEAYALAERLCDEFCNGEYDRLGIISTKYVSMLSQEPTVSYILPLTGNKEKSEISVVFEPEELLILNSAVPEYVAGTILAAIRESFACEVMARRTAMDSAGKNAQEMLDSLRLQYNRARQGAITQEITEIVAGSGE